MRKPDRPINKQERTTRATFARYLVVLALAGTLFSLHAFTQTPANNQSAKPADAVADSRQSDKPDLQIDKDKLSYAYGATTGEYFRRQGLELNPDLFNQGVRDGLCGAEPRFTWQEVRAIVAAAQKELKVKQHASLKAEQAYATKMLAEKNRAEGDAFLAENKRAEGVVTLDSGLQYKILRIGDGKKPRLGDTVVCHYRGTLIDGTEFDSSYKRNQPSTFRINRVIKGWTEALQLMPLGSRWHLFIPPTLAYGARGAGSNIGPDATLVFEVELLEIKEGASPSDSGSASKERRPSESHSRAVQAGGSAETAGIGALKLSYKLDPRVSKSTYSGERWVSPPVYSRIETGKSVEIEARVQAVDSQGKPVQVTPEWTSADLSVATISPARGSQVIIKVLSAGESPVRVAANGVSTEVVVKSSLQNASLSVEISQAPVKEMHAQRQ